MTVSRLLVIMALVVAASGCSVLTEPPAPSVVTDGPPFGAQAPGEGRVIVDGGASPVGDVGTPLTDVLAVGPPLADVNTASVDTVAGSMGDTHPAHTDASNPGDLAVPSDIGPPQSDTPTTPPPPKAPLNDLDGDGLCDPTVYLREEGRWLALGGNGAAMDVQHGIQWEGGWYAGEPAPGDFDGDGVTDLAVYLPETGTWSILASTGGPTQAEYGYARAAAVPADYDGDGVTDLSVYGPMEATWYVMGSTAGHSETTLGGLGALPVPADYDGDGRADLAVYSKSAGAWTIIASQKGAVELLQAVEGATPTAGDFDGDGAADVALFQHVTGSWHILRLDGTAIAVGAEYGFEPTTPVPADYDGDGVADLSVYHQGGGTWYYMASSAGHHELSLGGPGAVPAMGRWTSPRHPIAKPTGGFLWKPVSESTGHLLVLLPGSFQEGDVETVVISRDPAGEDVIEPGIGKYHGLFGDRQKWRFPEEGAFYGGPCFAVIRLKQSLPQPYRIPNGAERQE